ncbi:hypothetical protein KY284_012602 [Solanum tuberosum]|nr:hypothetical protein KY284_012602 [Solanum tuberosum]
MSHFNPLSSILNKNKFEDPNYECPIKLADPTAEEVQASNKWVKADEMARCYILASMANVLQHHHQSMTSSYNMLASLKEMFGEQNRAAKEHVLKLMSYLNELEILGAEIDKESQVEMILQTLPDSFQQFRLNYNMNKIDMSLAKLLNELRAAETIIKHSGSNVQQPAAVEENIQDVQDIQDLVQEVAIPVVAIRRNGRFIRKPERFTLLGESYDRIPEEPNTEPLNYAKALHDKDAEMLIVYMKSEMVSMYSYQVWDFVEPPVDVKHIGFKEWLSSLFDMKDLGEVAHFLGIKLMQERKQRILGLSQALYIDTILARFNMANSKKGFLPFRHGITLLKDQSAKMTDEIERMNVVPDASTAGSLMYAMLYFQLDRDSRKSTSGYVFTLGGGAVIWRSIKQSCVVDSTMEAEYVASSEAAKEVVWLGNFQKELGVVPSVEAPITLCCDNSGAVANLKEPRSHKRSKNIERKYHLIRDITQRGDVRVLKIESKNNLADPLTKGLPQKAFDKHVEEMGVKIVNAW